MSDPAAAGQPPQKRPRVEDSEKKPSESARHSDFWFSDGNVVFQVQKTLFRVYRGTLCVHSEVFKGMFEIPQPEVPEQFDGCPIVQLQDELKDFEVFMTVLYDPLWLDRYDIAGLDITLSFAISLLKMSNKYVCPALRKKAISILKELIPTEISSYEKISELKKVPMIIFFRLLSVARETNLRILMPCAYLVLATKSPSHFPAACRKMGDNAPWEDVAVFLAGRAYLVPAQLNHVYAFAVNFQRTTTCSDNVSYVAYTTHSKPSCTLIKVEAKNVVEVLDGYTKWDDAYVKSLCGPCKAHAKKVFDEGQTTFWTFIPKAFGLGSWEDLRRESEEVVKRL